MKAEEVLEIIKNMDNEERWKLLNEMYDTYFNMKHEKAELDLDY
ncbi:hypothetical protein P4T04_15605 [Bacillus badius]|nr:hypothetical protein [Bacillus badius]